MVIFLSYVSLPEGRIPKGIPLDSMYSWNAGSLTVFCETHCTRHPKVFQTYMPVVENHNDAAVVYTPATSSEHSWLDCTSPFFDVGDIFYLK